MNRSKSSMAAGVAAGMAAMAAMGAAGAYMAYTKPKETKKMLRKATQNAEKALTAVPKMRVYSVAGNCDFGALEPLDGLAAFDSVVLFYTHGHMYGVKYDLDTLAEAAAARGAEVALFGHTHIPLSEQQGTVLLFNPGSCGRCYVGPDTYGVMTLADGQVVRAEHKEVPKR